MAEEAWEQGQETVPHHGHYEQGLTTREAVSVPAIGPVHTSLSSSYGNSTEEDDLKKALALSEEEARLDAQEEEALALAIQLSKEDMSMKADAYHFADAVTPAAEECNHCLRQVRWGCRLKVRLPCVYGSHCYRRNPEHREHYSHPGDEDFGLALQAHPSIAAGFDAATSQVSLPESVANRGVEPEVSEGLRSHGLIREDLEDSNGEDSTGEGKWAMASTASWALPQDDASNCASSVAGSIELPDAPGISFYSEDEEWEMVDWSP